MEIKTVEVDGKKLEYVAEMTSGEYENNEMPESTEIDATMDLSNILPQKIDEMEDTVPILMEDPISTEVNE